MSLDWKPRHRDMIIGDIPWLARIADKSQRENCRASSVSIYLPVTAG